MSKHIKPHPMPEVCLASLKEKLDNNSKLAATGCIEWVGGKYGKGYGRLYVAGKQYSGHRLTYYAATGEDPGDLHVLHRCDNPSCINPEHLFLGTHRENMQDRNKKGRVIKPCNKGSNNGRALVTAEQVIQIREDYSSGKQPKEDLMRWTGLSKSGLAQILHRRTWSHI